MKMLKIILVWFGDRFMNCGMNAGVSLISWIFRSSESLRSA